MKNDDAIKFIISVLFVGYLIGTTTHILHFIDVIKLGFYNSAKVNALPPFINAYWLSLTIIDPIIALLLLKKAKLGALAAFVNILINVIVNSSVEISRLNIISLKSIYESLGNIYNALQIALLSFSLLTLPILLSRKEYYKNLFGKLPCLLVIIGLTIHLFGLIKIIMRFESLWILWVHVSMIVIDGTLLYLLMKKLKIGYVLALILFGSFGLLQLTFAVAIFFGIKCSFNLTMAMTISMCCLAITSLILKKDNYLKIKNNENEAC